MLLGFKHKNIGLKSWTDPSHSTTENLEALDGLFVIVSAHSRMHLEINTIGYLLNGLEIKHSHMSPKALALNLVCAIVDVYC